MSTEKPTLKETEKEKIWASSEDVIQRESSSELSKKLTQINNVLQVLDFPNNQEETYRKVLEQQEAETLQNLAWKSKTEIIMFLISVKKKGLNTEKVKTVKIDNLENKEQTIETQRIAQKIQKIKSAFPSSILSKNPDIATKLNSLESIDDPQEKDKILQEILQVLKNPWKLKSITDDLWGADKTNPKYVEFRNALVGLDSSFESYFTDLENVSLNTDEIIEGIETESWSVVDIDLKSNPPLSKMSLLWSSYSFDEEIDKQALEDILDDSQNELDEIKNSFSVLKDFGISFDELLTSIRENWWKPNFQENMRSAIANFSNDVFSNLTDVYDEMGIQSNEQIKDSDISSFSEIDSPADLKLKIENIKAKFLKIKSTIWEVQAWILKNYQSEIRELVTRESESKEKQLEVLKFMKLSGFDLIPKEISNRIIRNIKSGLLVIPWLALSTQNIDLKNGHFGEKGVFVDKEAWLNIESKRNLVKFMNKIISWTISEPLNVKEIINGFSVTDPFMLKNELLKANVVDGLGWKYTKIVENLKKENQ